MKRLLLSLLGSVCLLAAQGQIVTPQQVNQLQTNAAPFQALDSRALQIVEAFLVAGIAGVAASPNTLLANASAFQSVSDQGLQQIQTYLLTQLTGFSTSSGPSVVESLINTRVGTTRGINYKNDTQPTNWFYVASGEGIVRAIEYTSDGGDGMLDYRTNRSLRIYVDAGTINFGAASPTFPAGNLAAIIPFSSIMSCKYWPTFRTNFNSPLTFGTRYVGWVETTTLSASIAHYTFTLRYPMPFTNGIAIVPWDEGVNNNFTNGGFSFVNYELGTLPTAIRGYRLRTSRTVTNFPSGGSIANGSPVLLNYTGGGELVSIYISATNDSANLDTFWEGVWKQQPDGIPASEAFGCAGGEDLFNNGYFFDAGANSTWDWGTRYIHRLPTESYYVEAYRHFSGMDSQRWTTNTRLWFEGVDVIKAWDILLVFYGK